MSALTRTLAVSTAGILAAGLGVIPAGTADADDSPLGYQYHPQVQNLYAPTPEELAQQNKGNSVLYPKSARLDSGRIVAAFERSIGDPVGQTMPVYKSDDHGTTWQKLSDVAPPAELSDDPVHARYTSNWTNPYLYVLPQAVGDLAQGTLLMATLVSGDDGWYRDQKADDPSWVPTEDGDRQDLAIALYASTDEGSSWDFVNIIGTGGWSGDYGRKFSSGNLHHQQDPVWEPYLMVHEGQLVAYYTDENDWESFDPDTGVLTERPDNLTGARPESGRNPTDTGGQILLHKTWDGEATSTWSAPVLDHYGRFTPGVGFTDRPGMTNVVPTTDGKWILTAEFGVWKVSDDPLRFWDVPSSAPGFHRSGSPVIVTIPHPTDPARWSLVFNNGSTGNDVWVNESGRSDGEWLPYKTPIGAGYSRNLQYVPETGRLLILRGTWGGSPITYSEVDLGRSQGAYYSLVNRKTGQVIGTGGRTQDFTSSGSTPDVALEAPGSATNPDTQAWHAITKDNGTVTFLNKAGGRAIGLDGGRTAAGTRLAQWVDEDATDKQWNLVDTGDGFVTLQSAKAAGMYATASDADAPVSLQPESTTDPLAQQWQLVVQAPTQAELAARPQAPALVVADAATAGASIRLDAGTTSPGGVLEHAGATGTVLALAAGAAEPVTLGTVTFDAEARVDVTLPSALPAGAYRLVVLFDALPLLWDAVTVESVTDPARTGEVEVSFDVDATEGGLSLQVTDGAVDLGAAQLTEDIDVLVAEGRLPAVRVTDTRAADPGWTLSGSTSAFTSTAGLDSGASMGWAPAVVAASEGQAVTAGPVVAADDGLGLGLGATLAHTGAGHGRGTADLDAALLVHTPTTTPAGAYTSTITLTLS